MRGVIQMLAAGTGVQLTPEDGGEKTALPEEFADMWDAHPHNYLDPEEGENTSSSELMGDVIGWRPDEFGNTCAIRLSEMWNQLGGDYKITKDKAVEAGIKRGRVFYGPTSKGYYILSAKEMWQYVSHHFGSPHEQWPKDGTRFKSSTEFQAAFDSEISSVVYSKKGIVAFDKIFSYSGTGHVDIFNGENLSDAGSWYDCQSLKVWYI